MTSIEIPFVYCHGLKRPFSSGKLVSFNRIFGGWLLIDLQNRNLWGELFND